MLATNGTIGRGCSAMSTVETRTSLRSLTTIWQALSNLREEDVGMCSQRSGASSGSSLELTVHIMLSGFVSGRVF